MEAKDRVEETLIDALAEAVAVGQEMRLYRAGKLDGLFPSRVAGCVEAAGRALAQGLLERTRLEVKGKVEIEWVRITPLGIQYLHDNESPLRALTELRTALQAGQRAVPLWIAEARSVLGEVAARIEADAQRWHQRLDMMERRVVDALRRMEASAPMVPPELARDHPWCIDALNYLDRRRNAGATQPCPLPELFSAVLTHHPAISLGTFHEGLRLLHQRQGLTLIAADASEVMTGPEFALLDDATIYYYATR